MTNQPPEDIGFAGRIALIRWIHKNNPLAYNGLSIIVILAFGALLFSDQIGILWFDDDFFANVYTEGLSITLTILILNRLASNREEQRQKQELIVQMGSKFNNFAMMAVEQLRAKDWHKDGSLVDKKFIKAHLQKADLTDADLRKTDFSDAKLKGANLDGADLQQANLIEADLRQATITLKTNLQETCLKEANLQGINLLLHQLPDTNLSGADLRESNLQESKLQYLNGAKLQGANLVKADLRGADLVSANLQKARLILAQLNYAELIGADLHGADLRGADLTGILMDMKLADYYFDGATLPDESLYESPNDLIKFINGWKTPQDLREKLNRELDDEFWGFHL